MRRLAESLVMLIDPRPAPTKPHCIELEVRTFERGPSVKLKLDSVGVAALGAVLAVVTTLVLADKLDLNLLSKV